MNTSFTSLKTFFSLLLLSLVTLSRCVASDETTTAKAPYPLSTCVVSGDKLGTMEAPVIIDHEGTEVRFCCKDCVVDFNKEPEKYLSKLHAATMASPEPAAASTTPKR